MTEHVNNICNLSNIDGEKVNFITTDNYGVTQSLKNTGDIVLLRDADRHDIYVAGEHIAGGYGFDNPDNLDTLNTVAVSYYSYIQYVKENYDTIKKLVDENNGDVVSTVPTTYTDIQESETAVLNIDNVSFTYSHTFDPSNIIKTDPLIVKAGCDVMFDTITFDASGNCDIAYLDIYSKNFFDSKHEWRGGSDIYGKYYTYYRISKSLYDEPIILTQEYQHTEIDGSNVNTLVLSCDGSVNNHTDSVLLAVKDETMPQSPGNPMEFTSKPIYWQLPYLFGSHEINSDNFNEYDGTLGTVIYRDDCVVDKMINTEITIQFSSSFAHRSHGYFACPQQWGEPKFTHKKSNLPHQWEKLTTGPIVCNVNGATVYYNVYRTKIEYFNNEPITWVVSDIED